MTERRTLACGCVLGNERCFYCRPGLHVDQETALAISEIFMDRQERLKAAVVATCGLEHDGCRYPKCACLITPNLVKIAIVTWERFNAHGECGNRED